MALLRRRGFIWPSAEIYGGAGGLYDYGPLGAPMKENIVRLWKRYFVLGEGFAEIDAPALAPEEVFRASGHLDKFSDLLTECAKCGEVHRADHLLKGKVGSPGTLSADGVKEAIRRLGVKCPVCGGVLSDAYPFNLMFRTTLGPGSKRAGYLRPETAQAMFTDFKLLYRHFRERLPFGVVQVGRGYRNEISPRQGLIRLREFNMAEAEIFVHPERKADHPRFAVVGGEVLNLVPAGKGEQTVVMTAGEALRQGLIANGWVAYYMALTKRFLVDCGADPARLRFRQHERTEMAHYAADCWDAEALHSSGWVEIVGIADRTCFDLDAHMRHSGADLRAGEPLPAPRTGERTSVRPLRAVLGPRYRKEAGGIVEYLEKHGAEAEVVEAARAGRLPVPGTSHELKPDEYEIVQEKVTVTTAEFTPHVIEPSFGLDRIFYTVVEHCFTEQVRRTEEGEEKWTVLKFPATVAPVKAGVFPLMAKDGLDTLAGSIDAELRAAGLATFYDEGGSIGRRYARMDEVGTPFCVTVDYQSLSDGTVTVRDRDSTKQVRVARAELARYLGLNL